VVGGVIGQPTLEAVKAAVEWEHPQLVGTDAYRVGVGAQCNARLRSARPAWLHARRDNGCRRSEEETVSHGHRQG
jgi:hypothetical protein